MPDLDRINFPCFRVDNNRRLLEHNRLGEAVLEKWFGLVEGYLVVLKPDDRRIPFLTTDDEATEELQKWVTWASTQAPTDGSIKSLSYKLKIISPYFTNPSIVVQNSLSKPLYHTFKTNKDILVYLYGVWEPTKQLKINIKKVKSFFIETNKKQGMRGGLIFSEIHEDALYDFKKCFVGNSIRTNKEAADIIASQRGKGSDRMTENFTTAKNLLLFYEQNGAMGGDGNLPLGTDKFASQWLDINS